MNYRYVMILEPHSERTKGLLGTRCYPQKFNFESHLDIQSNIVFPDAGGTFLGELKERYPDANYGLSCCKY